HALTIILSNERFVVTRPEDAVAARARRRWPDLKPAVADVAIAGSSRRRVASAAGPAGLPRELPHEQIVGDRLVIGHLLHEEGRKSLQNSVHSVAADTGGRKAQGFRQFFC